MSTLWDERYKKYGATPRAAMFKGLPEILNSYLHNWQVQELARTIPDGTAQTLLDLGCGYGRLATALSIIYPDCKIYGLDYSHGALALFPKQPKLSAVQGRLKNLPFRNGTVPVVFCVTALMYLEPADQIIAIREMVRVLDGHGVGILIENERSGVNWLAGFNRLRFREPQSTEGINAIEQTFSRKEVESMLAQAGAQVVREAGCPIFTLALPLLVVLSYMNNSLVRAALAICGTLDALLSHWYLNSIYISYQFRRREK